MRGTHERQSTMLSIISPEQRVPQDHPLRKIKTIANKELNLLAIIYHFKKKD